MAFGDVVACIPHLKSLKKERSKRYLPLIDVIRIGVCDVVFVAAFR